MEDTKKTLLKKESQLIPKCLSGNRSPAYVNTGHLSPCCWVDGDDVQILDYYKELFTDKMKLENHEQVEDIVLSDEWNIFFKKLIDKPEEAHDICWKHCGEFAKANKQTPMRDIYSSEQYKALKEKYQLKNARPRCTDGISAVLTKK